MFFGLFWGDWTIFLLLPAMIFALWAQFKVQSTFKKYDRMLSSKNITGAEAARRILDANGLYKVNIERVQGHLNDHFDPRANVIRLSDATYGSVSVAAIGVAAHEAGHALQYAYNYSPIRFRMAMVKITRIGSMLGPILIVVGCIMTYTASVAGHELGLFLYALGLVLFSAVAVFQLATLPVEIDASSRALVALERVGALNGDELKGAKKVLSAAALTYIAALITSIMQILYYLSRFRPRD